MDTYNNNSITRNSICIFSYNTRGFSEDKQDVCRSLMIKTESYFPILCNQENFLLRNNKFKIKQCLPDAHIIFKTAVKDSLEGRPKNGMFIAIPEEIKEYVDNVSPSHWRVQAIVITTHNNKILLINSYFPTDPKTIEFDTGDLLSTLSAIDNILDDNEFDSVIWTGDINADFIRNTRFTNIVDNFIAERSLLKSWNSFDIDFTHSFEIDDQSYTSTLDHFFWSESLSHNVINADVLHMPSNTSDHSPIFCSININILVSKCAHPVIGQVKPSWKKASNEQKEQFVIALDNGLRNIIKPTCIESCQDSRCNKENHTDDCDDFLVSILDTIKITADTSLPCSRPMNKKHSRIANWDNEVKPFKENAMFWHSVWLSADRPINTELHRIMKRTRNIYHFQIRKNRKMTEILKRNALLDACINNNGDIFKAIKKQRHTHSTVPTKIDNITTNIENHFANIYSQLYNSVNDRTELNILARHISENINSSSINDVNRITPELVKEALTHLKVNKTDPILKFGSECLNNAPFILCEQLCMVFRCFLIHGHISSFLMISTLIPIIKDKLSDNSSSNNYRSIALSSLILKVLDWVIILLHGKELSNDELQFGFQQNTSTNMCTWLVVETIDYFQRNGSDVYACVMDMNKAFDNVKHSTLFWKLLEKGMPPIIIRLLIKMYEKQEANVQWNDKLSKTFPINNGVKQGAVLSPKLYCVYIDGLFKLLRKRTTGCWVNGMFMGIAGYADDLLLLSPTIDGLQEMVKTCEEFSKSHNLTYSTHDNPLKCKTKCIAFVKKEKALKDITLNGNPLPWVRSAKHLGSRIGQNINGLKNDLMEKRAEYINKVNELNQEFHFAHPLTKVKINNIFNTHFYGSQLWDLFSEEAIRLEKSWNVSQRKILGIPRNTHRYFMEPLSNTRHIMFSLRKKFISFIRNIATSTKTVLRNLLHTVKHDCRSITGRNLRKIMLLANKTNVNDVTVDDMDNLVYCAVPIGEQWKVDFAKEIIQVKNRNLEINILDNSELEDILQTILT